MHRLRAIAVGSSLALAIAWPVFGAAETACAVDGPSAGLVVDTGSRVLELCVALDDATVSGTHLIQLASAQYGLSYAFGFGDQAVCMLADVGVSGGECFEDYPDFWGYWHGDGQGQWGWSSTSPASYRVNDGMLEGWVWGPGDSGSTHEQPPELTPADVCAAEQSVTPSPPKSTAAPDPSSGSGGTGGGPGQATPTSGADPSTTSETTGVSPSTPPESSTPSATTGHARDGSTRSSGTSSEPTPGTGEEDDRALRAGGLTDGSDGGPPAGLFAAVALGAIFGIAGGLRLRWARITGRKR
jgi:hypothetical protein